MKLGILSDTHGLLDKKLFEFFAECDEIWHAGDVGDPKIVQILEDFKPLVCVYGNIDGTPIRNMYPRHQRKKREGLDIWMTHIGGYPGNYDRYIRDRIKESPPDIFITGHSHILKVMPDRKLKLLHINPGAAGNHGFHHVRTAVRTTISDRKISDLEVIELGPRSVRLEP